MVIKRFGSADADLANIRPRFTLALFLVLTAALSSCARTAVPAAPERLAEGPKQGVYYEVFVRSFADSDGDGAGDFNGLTGKLDYLSDLGVTGLWLMPCFASPSYHGYDISDYYGVHPDYGTMDDFETFIQEAGKRGISVILDLVINHTSAQHPWFQASKDPDSPYRDWYHWSEDGEGVNLNATAFGGNRVWNNAGSGYYAALFWDQMPDLNFDSPELRREIEKIAKFWLDKGVAGFRLDAAMHLYSSQETRTGGKSPGELNLAYWAEFADYCRSVKPGCYLVGEIWDSPGTRAPYAAPLDSVFHFDMGEALARAIVNGSSKGNAFINSMRMEYDRLASVNPDAINAIFLSNHDQNRICTALRNDRDNLKMAASVYLTMQGLPFVYYGEELGMLGGKPDEYIRTPFLWGGDDPALCTWIESPHNKNTVPFMEQNADPDSLLSLYRRVMNLRIATPALFDGVLEPAEQPNDAVLSYTMTAPGQTVLVLHNLSVETQTVDLNGSGRVLFVTAKEGFSAGGTSVILPPKCSAVIEL